MPDIKNNDDSNKENGISVRNAIGIPIGTSIGLIFGLNFDNLALGLVFGAAFGILLGITIGTFLDKNRKSSEDKNNKGS